MALKKKVPTNKPIPKTTGATTTAPAAASKRKPIAPPARKPIAPPVKQAEPPKAEPKVAPPARKAPVRKPSVKKPEPPKEVKPVEKAKEEPKKPSEARKSPEAPKPVVTAGSERTEPRPRRVDTPTVERLSDEALRAMEMDERYKLFKKLNKNPEVFVPLRKELPKQMVLRKDEALIREIISAKPPKSNHRVLYCAYCVDWQVFHYHSWTGYHKCTGCGITSRDFYIGIDNHVFGKE